jgi:plastocyanin
MIAHNAFSVLPCLLLGAALLLATPSSGAEIEVAWAIPDEDSLPPRTAMVGDTVTFDWFGNHNVYVHPSSNCDETDSILVGLATGATYTFTEADVGDLVFACQVSSHCIEGLILTFTVASEFSTSAPTIAPTMAPSAKGGAEIEVVWDFPDDPDDDSLPPLTALVGDTVTFDWLTNHNVYVHPSMTCDETDRILVGLTTGATYTFTEADVGDLVFACDVGSHCEGGLILTFTVASEFSTSTPSMAPSGAASIILQSSTTVSALVISTATFAYAGL